MAFLLLHNYTDFIFLLLAYFNGKLLSLVLSLIITIIFSVAYPFLLPIGVIESINGRINNFRKKTGRAFQRNEPVRELIFDNQKYTSVYIFDFNKSLINCGYITNINIDINEPYEFIIEPFDEAPELKTFEDVFKWSQNPEVESKVLINITEKVQIYFIDD